MKESTIILIMRRYTKTTQCNKILFAMKEKLKKLYKKGKKGIESVTICIKKT